MCRKWACLILLVSGAAAFDSYQSAKQKIDLIEAERLRHGARVTLTYPELEAWALREAPEGVRNLHIQVDAQGNATGSALVDFAKVRRAQGNPPGWFMSKLLEGERPLSVTARVRSAGGSATVDVQRVEISGVVIDGSTLDFLIQNILLPLYPTAAIGKPFELGHRIDRFDIAPASVAVVIR
jgi:hypothetical protein